MSHSLPAQAWTHVMSGIIFAHEVRRFWRVFPGKPIATGGGQSVDDGGGRRGESHGREEDDIVLGAQVIELGDGLRADVLVGNLQIVEGHAPPAFGLRAEPGVHEGDARGMYSMSLDGGSRG